MGFFERLNQLLSGESDPQPPVSTPAAPSGSTSATVPGPGGMVNVKGVGDHQSALAGPPRRVKVELFPYERDDLISVKLDGKLVGEILYERKLHEVLLGIRHEGLPPVIVDGQIMKGDWVPRFLAVSLPSPNELKTLLPKGWGPPKTSINLHAMNSYQSELESLFTAKPAFHEAAVTFRPRTTGKYAGQPEGIVAVSGVVIGELAARASEQWAIIHEDQEAGIEGHLKVKVYQASSSSAGTHYSVEAIYHRESPSSKA